MMQLENQRNQQLEYIDHHHNLNHSVQHQTVPIYDDLDQQQYSIFEEIPKYNPSQIREPNLRNILDTQTIKVQKRDLGELERKKRKLIMEFQNIKKRNDYYNKLDAQKQPIIEAQNQQMLQQHQQMIQQNEQQRLHEQTIQDQMQQQQQLILQLINQMQGKKEENIKQKNEKLLNKIKKEELKAKKLKRRINKGILMQLSGQAGAMDQMNGLDLLSDSEDDLEDLDHDEDMSVIL
ncbi:UNKNOWN [Stylonychia lemnae]|uniref:Uncharacterized protein n=1 Tax=Stylonychia lemnae TaxID=5949 RepID=A0A078A4X3_STYLE|nr:UNKNOWN [Stylonychia lemnae]|eukprot:CDW76894.1 UNKNOWN [Stylonychia lemnae]